MSAFPPESEPTNAAWRAHYAWLASVSAIHRDAPTSADQLADRAALLGIGPAVPVGALRAARQREVCRELDRRKAEHDAARSVLEPRLTGGDRRIPRGVADVLAALSARPATQQELADRLGKSPATVSRALKAAESIGRVVRPSDPRKGQWRLRDNGPRLLGFGPDGSRRPEGRVAAAIAALGPDATAKAIAQHAGISERHVRRLRNGR